MRITFLGTGTSQGVPPIGCTSPVCLSDNPKDKRLRASVHVEVDGLSLVIDAGPDFRYQLQRAGIQRLDGLIFTHEHRDHTGGLDDIRPFNYLQNGPVDVFLHERVLRVFQRQYDYIFDPNPYPGIPQINWNLIDLNPFQVKGCTIIPIEVYHYRLPVFGFRIGDFTYITDANRITPAELDKARGSKVLVLNALRHEPHISHFTLAEAVAVAQEIGAAQTFFTHMSHQIGFHEEVNTTLPAGMALAYDNQVVML